ncbi:TetR/AcrR family transcriptional regulator [Actinophytocola oryzae]|uniref:TetR family transcriptional regulator n=1 Tax=Actinophytocola oryzae TaxID=502181 RepID=A0A4R7UVJ8_9PSEU|nr:TetR family transcriptional regulator [Actinophytocola oryzae]
MSSKPLRADARRNRARILAAAEEVFAVRGAVASTEEVASAAGVAIGTVFRHFPTKQDLLGAILKDLLAELADAAAHDDLFAFFRRVVEAAAEKRFVVELLAGHGVDVEVAGAVGSLGDAVAALLVRAREEGLVRDGVQLDEILALLAAAGQGALRWSPDLRARTLEVIFAGLRR